MHLAQGDNKIGGVRSSGIFGAITLLLLGIGVPLAFGSPSLGIVLIILAFLTGGLTIRQWLKEHQPTQERVAAEEQPATAESPKFVSSLPITTIEEAGELAKECTATAEAIYAFLTERADEAKVLAEYRQRFEAKVSGLYTDLLAADFGPPDQLAYMVTSLTDVQRVAYLLGSRGENFSAERLERLSARARREIQARRDEEG